MHLLVDGDIVVYRAAFGVEKAHDFGDGEWASSADLGDAQERFSEIVGGLISACRKAGEVTVVLTGDTNFRRDLSETYKLQRSKVRRPILLKPLRKWLIEGSSKHRVKVVEGLEADDVLGIMATLDPNTIVASLDKDLLQIPGRHIDIVSLKKSVVTLEQGDRLHMRQTLTGDVTDNYPGCPGVGPKSADKLLDEAKAHPWPDIVKAYAKKGLTEDDALLQARLARILRAEDYDFKNKQVRLWLPPKGER